MWSVPGNFRKNIPAERIAISWIHSTKWCLHSSPWTCMDVPSKDTFEYHINDVVQRASIMSGWVLRTFKSRSPTLMLTLFKTMVLSKLDSCSPVYHPTSSVSLTTKIERVQRSFTRKIEGMNGLNYWLRLKLLRLYSVERRRERFRIVYLFKMLHGFVQNIGMTYTLINQQSRRQQQPSSNNWGHKALVTEQQGFITPYSDTWKGNRHWKKILTG